MEAWHFVDLNDIPSLIALSLTTSRWGLEPFPGNLAVSNQTLKHLQAQDVTSISVWQYVDGCARNTESEEVFNDDIPTNTTFCSKPKLCGQSDCINLLEGTGRTTTGPTDANIIGLAHGISILIVIISTIVMGWLTRSFDKWESKFPRREQGLTTEENKKYWHRPEQPNNPPVQIPPVPYSPKQYPPEQYSADPVYVRAPPDEKKSKDISQCTDLLRQMYDMELQIKSAKDNIWGTSQNDNRLRERADALRNEIQFIVNDWRAMPPGYFTTEERRFVDEICNAINSYQRGR